MTTTDYLSTSDLFKNIEKEDIDLILNNFPYKIENYKKGDVVALRGDKCNNLMIVLKGELIARMVSHSGKFIQIDKIGQGRILAPAMLFASNNIFPVNVHPEQDVEILSMHKDVFLAAMQSNDKLLFSFMQIISNINRFLTEKINFLTLKSLRGKLADFLLSEFKKQGTETIVLGLTRQELADKFGVNRQSLARSLAELEEENLIAIAGKAIRIMDKQKLSEED